MAVDPLQFVIGPVSIGTARILAIGVGVYAFLTARHTWTAYQKGLEDRGSALLATWIMVGLTVMLWRNGAELLPAPFSLAVVAIYVAGITITLGYTLSNAEKRLAHWREQIQAIVDEWAARALPEEQREAWLERRFAQLAPEGKRKTPHLMMGVFIAIYAALGWALLQGIARLVPAGTEHGESLQNLHMVLDAGWLASGHMVGITMLLGLLFLLLPVEMVRLRFPEMAYPFKGTITALMRERERGLFGAHYYITATLPLAILWLTQDSSQWDVTLYAVMAVLGVTVFADSASALVGIRYGRSKWFHNPNKTYMGTVGGCAVAFLVALPFLGPWMAVAAAVAFFAVDVLAPVPFSVSDNILNPLVLAGTFILAIGRLDPWLPYY